MSETFDDFARKHKQEQQDQEQLAKDVGSEWEILKGFVSQFALDNRGVGTDKFQWEPHPELGSVLLVLKDVAAIIDGNALNGVSPQLLIRFDRRCAGPNREWNVKTPIPAKRWSLKPIVENGEFLWLVEERNLKASSAKLADEIAKELASHHLAYQKAYEHWTL